MFYFLTQMGFTLCTALLSLLASIFNVLNISHVSVSTAFLKKMATYYVFLLMCDNEVLWVSNYGFSPQFFTIINVLR